MNCPRAKLRPLAVAAFLILLPIALVAQAPVLTISAATLNIDSQTTDSYNLQGTFNGLSFSGAQTVTFSVGQFSGTIPMSSFVQQPGTNIFAYQDSTGLAPYWVSSLAIDLDAQTFTAQATGIILAGLPNPFAVQLGADESSSCTMARVEQLSVGSYQLTSGDGVGEPCQIPNMPDVEPPTVLAGAPTNVNVYVDLLPTPDLDPQSVQLFRADDNAQPVGDALCMLSDNGGGLYSCTVSLNEAAPATIPLLVQATAGSQTILSPGFSLQVVVEPITDAQIQQLVDIQNAMLGAAQNFTQFGDSVQARVLTLGALRALLQAQAGLTGQPVGLTPDGLSIGVRSDSGLPVVFVLNDLEDDLNLGAANASGGLAQQRRRSQVPHPPPHPESIAPAAVKQPPQCGEYRRAIVKNDRVLRWSPGSGRFGFKDPLKDIRDPLWNSTCPKFNFGAAKNPPDGYQLIQNQATIDSMKQFSDYGTIIINSHGGQDLSGQPFFVTGERVLPLLTRPQRGDGTKGISCGVWYDDPGCYWHVFPSHPNIVPLYNTIIYGAFCRSGSKCGPGGKPASPSPPGQAPPKRSFCEAFAPSGSKSTFYGFNGEIDNYSDGAVGHAVFDSLVNQYSSTVEAGKTAVQAGIVVWTDEDTKKVTRTPFVNWNDGAATPGGPPLPNDPILGLAYVGDPSLSSPQQQQPVVGSYTLSPGTALTLKAELDGPGSTPQTSAPLEVNSKNSEDVMQCTAMNYMWVNSAKGGHLTPGNGGSSPQDNYTSMDSTAKYTASSGFGAGDNIAVDYRPDQANPIAARACAQINTRLQCIATIQTASTSPGTSDCSYSISQVGGGQWMISAMTGNSATPYATFDVTLDSAPPPVPAPSSGKQIPAQYLGGPAPDPAGTDKHVVSVNADGRPAGKAATDDYKMHWDKNVPKPNASSCPDGTIDCSFNFRSYAPNNTPGTARYQFDATGCKDKSNCASISFNLY